jgi:integrase
MGEGVAQIEGQAVCQHRGEVSPPPLVEPILETVEDHSQSGDPTGELVELGKTTRSRRQVPLSARALKALDEIPPRLDTTFVFAANRGGPFDLANFRRRAWQPAIEASGVNRPARIYDMRSTFASNSLAAGISVFELARIMGTSVAMIERHYGTLIEGAGADIVRRLDAFDNNASKERQKGQPC